MKISNAIKEYLVECEIRKFTPRTLRGYKNHLNIFVTYCEEEGITEMEDVTLVVVRQFTQTMIKKGRKGTYINSLLKVIKVFIQYCYDEGYAAFNPKKNFKWVKEDKPVIMALIISTGITLLIKCIGINIENFEVNISYVSIIVFAVITGVYFLIQHLFKKKLSAVQIILISAFLGIIFSYIFEK